MVCLGGMTALCSQAILLGLGSHAKQTQDLLIIISNITRGLQASIQPLPSAKFPRIPYFLFLNREDLSKAAIPWSWASGLEDHGASHLGCWHLHGHAEKPHRFNQNRTCCRREDMAGFYLGQSPSAFLLFRLIEKQGWWQGKRSTSDRASS